MSPPKRRRIISDDECWCDLDDGYYDHQSSSSSHYNSKSVNHPITSLYDIPDGPILLILSFCSSSKLENNWDKVRFALKTLSRLSKSMRERILCLVRSIPVDVKKSLLLEPYTMSSIDHGSSSSSSSCYHDIRTICKYHMKIKSLSFMFNDQIYKSIFLHILNSCNLSCLQSLSLHVHPTSCNLDLLDTCDEIGVPLDRTHRAVLLSNWAFQETAARALEHKKACHGVKKMHLRFKIEEPLCGDLFRSLSKSLETLNLEGWCSLPNQDSYFVARSLSCLGCELEHLSKLKHVDFVWPRLRRDVLYRLKSSSLESLSLKGGLKIESLDCPCLKKMTLVFNTHMMDLRILKQCGGTLLDLTLIISNDSIEYQKLFDDLGNIVQHLSVLKRFSLVTGAPHELNIQSTCLEEINLCNAPRLLFKSCVCPKLQKISLNKDFPRAPFDVPWVPLNAADCRRELTTLPSAVGNLSFMIGECRFVGTQVPKSCVVEFI